MCYGHRQRRWAHIEKQKKPVGTVAGKVYQFWEQAMLPIMIELIMGIALLALFSF